MKPGAFTNMCEICGHPRGRNTNHEACSKIRQAQGFAGKKKISETERMSNARRVAKQYTAGTYKLPA